MIFSCRALRFLAVASCLLLQAAAPARAGEATPAEIHGIAMQGAPKYGPDFQHFDYVNPDAPKGGELREEAVGSFDSLNPFSIKGTAPLGLAIAGPDYVYDTLLARDWDEPFSLYPLVAQSIEVPDDRSWIVFHLNPAARFQDGKPVTADDVLFTWSTLRDKGWPSHRAYYSQVESAQALDAHTVRFAFKRQPDGQINRELPLILGLMPVLPRHDWLDRDIEDTTLVPPVGSGPYKVASVDPGRTIVYERDKNYWARDLPVNRGLYNFDRIRVDYFRDATAALEAFNAGVVNFRREYDPAKWMQGYAQSPDIDREAFPNHRAEIVRAYIYNLRRPLFRNDLFRRALAETFDFEWMNRALFYGLYHRTNSYFPNSELAATDAPYGEEKSILEKYKGQLPAGIMTEPYALPATDGSGPAGLRPNLREAFRLLKQAGFYYKNHALIDPGTHNPVGFEILLGDPGDERVTLEWTHVLGRLGIAVKIRTVDSAQFQERLKNFDYDVVLGRWINSLSPGSEQRNYWGSAAAAIPGSRNYAGLRDPVVDDLIDRLLATQNREDFVATARALDRVLLWNNASLPLYYAGADWLAWHKPLMHPAMTPLYGQVLEAWWSEPDARP